MELTIFDVIKGPIISDKSYRLNKKLKKLVLKVHPFANKPLIKDALEKLFEIKVDKINCLIRKGKNRMVKRKKFQGSATKIAIVTLKEGYSLDLFEQAETKAVVESGNKSATVGPDRG
ncbi:MAG: 50S ribosomal protein L23 [bacterium]|nr:50S ribosomal protein L23 [bacterium]